MKNFYEEKDGVFEVLPGAEFKNVAREALDIAVCNGRIVSFEFNGAVVHIVSDTDCELIHRDYNRYMNGCIGKNIGPYPSRVLHREEQKHDARILAEHERRAKEDRERYERDSESKRKKLQEKICCEPMEVLDDQAGDAWLQYVEKNKDPYGGRCVTYAEEWARLMQTEMAEGKELEDIAKQTSHEADYDGITGFMYGAAVSMLSQCWKHGERLRRWHNLDRQLGNEGEKANKDGGVLNPAILTIC